jgi:hypothetical protein
MRSWSREFACICVVSIFTAMTFGQSATTSLHGTVTDAKGAVVVGANVTITNPALGLSHEAKTNDQGEYQFLELPPGTYDVTVSARGFENTIEKGIQLVVRTPGTANVTLQVSGTMETVEVNATANLINTDDATMGHAFDSSQIQALPFEGREPTSILTLQAGVTFTGNNMDKVNSTTASGFDVDSRKNQPRTNIENWYCERGHFISTFWTNAC